MTPADLIARLREPSFRHCNCETCKFIDEAASALTAQAERIATLERTCAEFAKDEADLVREINELRQDAARYRFLRANLYAIDGEYGIPPQCAIVFKWRCDVPVGKGDSLDAAIDAAKGGDRG